MAHSPVHSTRFFAIPNFSGFAILYTVPAGKVAVVTCWTVATGTNLGHGGTYFRVGLLETIGAVDYYTDISTPNSKVINGRWVVPEEETLIVQTFSGYVVDTTASGFLLDIV